MGSQKELLKRISGALPEDSIIENQRGLTLFGIPLFSPKLLSSRLDPSHWQIIDTKNFKLKNIGDQSPLSRGELYPLTSSDSREQKWYVLMDFEGAADMDDQGWLYSWSFFSSRWKSKHGFVRRRIWVKKASEVTVCSLVPSPPEVQSSSGRLSSASSPLDLDIDPTDEFVFELRAQVLDRRRFELLDKFIGGGSANVELFKDQDFVGRIAECFEFKVSKEKFLNVWLPNALKS